MAKVSVIKKTNSGEDHRRSMRRYYAEVGENGHGGFDSGVIKFANEAMVMANAGIRGQRGRTILEVLNMLVLIA